MFRNKQRILKFLVSESSFKNNLSFMLQIFTEQKICKPDFSDLLFICFNKDKDFLISHFHSYPEINLKIATLENISAINQNGIKISFLLFPINQKHLSIKQKFQIRNVQSSLVIFTAFIPAPKMIKKIKSWTRFAQNCKINFP